MVLHLAPRLMMVFKERDQYLKENWQEAENVKNETNSLKSENFGQLENARGEAHHLIRKAIEETHIIKSTRLKMLEDELAKKMHKAQIRLEEDNKAVCNDIGTIVSQVVLQTVHRITGQSFTELQVNALVQDALKKVDGRPPIKDRLSVEDQFPRETQLLRGRL